MVFANSTCKEVWRTFESSSSLTIPYPNVCVAMTKISFDVDFNEDPEKILKDIQERAKAEVEKRESKEKTSAYLSTLHEKVNEEIKTEYKSATDLIRALTPFASPALKDKLSATSPTGRRKTVTMDRETYQQIKELLSQPNPNKAAISRDTGVSVVQVRKVASGGYDEKFGGSSETEKDSFSEEPSPEPASPPSFEDEAADDAPAPDLPSPPSFGDDGDDGDDAGDDAGDEAPASPPAPDLPSPPSFGDDAGEDASPPAPDLPSPPSFGDDDQEEETQDEPPAPDLPSPPSFGDDAGEDAPPPAPDLPSPPSFGDDDQEEEAQDEPPAPPPAPDLPSPPSMGGDEPPAPPPVPDLPSPPASMDDDDSGETDAPVAPPPPGPPSDGKAAGLTRPPGLSGKPTLKPGGKPGKPTLSLKKGKSKTKGLKITRPPQPGSEPPPPA